MKNILILGLLFYSTLTYSQENNKMFFNKLGNDTILFFLDKVGEITTEPNAQYYRLACLNSMSFELTGKVKDYSINHQKAYECNYNNQYLQGEVNCYYNNGQLRYHGYFNKSLRDSIWTYYYRNGKKEKIILFNDGDPYLKEFYKSNGKSVFVDGSGRYKGSITYVNEKPEECVIYGEIEAGKMEGAWSWKESTCSGIDYFKKGKYLKSETFRTNLPMTQMVSLTGFELHEDADIFKFIAIPRVEFEASNHLRSAGMPVIFKGKDVGNQVAFASTKPKNQQLKYKNSVRLDHGFKKELSNYLYTLSNKHQIENFWCLIQFTVSDSSKVENVFIHSNNKIISSNTNQFISADDGFTAVHIGKNPVACDVYLSVFFENGKINIPEYKFNNKGLNRSNLMSGN